MSLKRHLKELNLAGGQLLAWLELVMTAGTVAYFLPKTSLRGWAGGKPQRRPQEWLPLSLALLH